MWADLVVVSTAILHFLPGVAKSLERVSVQALDAEAAIEGLDERVVGWLAGPGEVERHVVGVSP